LIADHRNQTAAKRNAFLQACKYFSLDSSFVEKTLAQGSPDHWAIAFGGGQRGGRAASCLATYFARVRCAEGNHVEEARLGLTAARDVITDEPPAYHDAWISGLSGIEHQLSQALPADKVKLLTQLYELSLAAIKDLDRRFAMPGHPLASQNRGLDSIVSFLLKAEQALGIPLSDLSADLERRERNRTFHRGSPAVQTFFQKHRHGLMKLWHDRREEWFRKRYELKTGKSAPTEFMVKNSAAPSGWQIREDIRCNFDPQDYRDFHADMEALYRQQQGLPAKGEGWVSQTYLANCVREVLSGYEILLEARTKWLGQQRLDIFVPALKLAIEYQGEQHYLPLEHWGGEQGLKDRQVMDETKRSACQKAGIHLIEWHYKIPINIESVRTTLIDHGVSI
jgi:hypothetical protein